MILSSISGFYCYFTIAAVAILMVLLEAATPLKPSSKEIAFQPAVAIQDPRTSLIINLFSIEITSAAFVNVRKESLVMTKLCNWQKNKSLVIANHDETKLQFSPYVVR